MGIYGACILKTYLYLHVIYPSSHDHGPLLRSPELHAGVALPGPCEPKVARRVFSLILLQVFKQNLMNLQRGDDLTIMRMIFLE